MIFSCAVAFAADPDFPKLTGRVTDAAGILAPEARERIEAKLKAHEDKTTDQVVVATVPSLEGLTVEDYANRLFRTWALGQKDKNNGALLLVAPNERKVRIEVGYGLEGALTDALGKVIITTAITPKFKKGDFAGGIEAGVDAMLSILTGDAEEWHRRAEVRSDEMSTTAVIVWLIVFILLAYLMFRMGGGSGRRGRGGGFVIVPGSSGGWSGGFSDSGGGFSGGGGSSGGEGRRVIGSRCPPLSDEERARITEAVRVAETRTSGEIVVMVSACAGLYRSIALAFALIVGLAVPWPLIAFTPLSAATIFVVQALAILLTVLLTSSDRLRPALVPSAIRRRRAHEAAQREFLARGLTRTKGRTGILIYIALAERYAEIVADSGVRARVPDATWRNTVEDILGAAGRGALAEGLVSAVGKVGDILARDLPPGPEGDELPDRVIVVD